MRLRNAIIDIAPLRSSRAFRWLWIGGTFSGFGGQLALVAVMFQVWTITRSAVWTGAIGLAQALPLVVLGMFAGSVVDRVDRRKFYLLATAGQFGCSILLAGQALLSHFPVVGVLLLVALQSCFAAAGAPAARTFIPRLLPGRQLAAGLALNRISFQTATLLGPAVGGVIVGWLGVGGCYLIDAITFAVAFYGAYRLPAMSPAGERSRAGVRGVLDGLKFLVRNSLVRGVLLVDLAATVLAMPIGLFPLVNAELFGDNPRTLGLFLTAIGVGGVLASVFSGMFIRLSRPGVIVAVSAGIWGATLMLFGISPNPWVGLAFLVLAGAADTVSVVTRSTVVQLATPDALRGRVAAAEQIVGQAGPNIGNLRGGIVAGATSGTVALAGGGLLCVLAVAIIAACTPRLREFRQPD